MKRRKVKQTVNNRLTIPLTGVYYIPMTTALLKSDTLSAISRDVGQVFFASLFIGQIIEPTSSATIIVLGLFFSLFFWFVSVLLAKE